MRAGRFVISSVAAVALAAGGVAVTAGTASASSVTCQQNALNRYNYYGHLANLDFSSSVADYAAGDFEGGALWFNAYLQALNAESEGRE